MSYFSIYLEDMFHNPSPVEARILTVKILRNNDTISIRPAIFPQRDFQGTICAFSRIKYVQLKSLSKLYVFMKQVANQFLRTMTALKDLEEMLRFLLIKVALRGVYFLGYLFQWFAFGYSEYGYSE